MLAKFPNLKELNLSDNEINGFPRDMSQLRFLANLNLNGNSFVDVSNALII
jgi:Leucine-rich repeat (LRR) protein